MSAGAAFAAINATSSFLGGLLDRSRLRAESRVYEENARLSLLEGEEVVARTGREERQVSGAAVAAMAENGGAIGTGTALDIIEQNAIEREVEIGNLRAQAQGRARNFKQAAVDARFAGDQALIGGIMEAGASIGSYAAQVEARSKVDAAVAVERKARLDALEVGLQQDPRNTPGASRLPVGVDLPTMGGFDPFNPYPTRRRPRFGVLSLPGAN